LYKVKEIYYTLQGEGFHQGRAAVFCRFAGCNLWSGIEKDRENAICKFCDTDFLGMDGENGGSYNKEDLYKKIKSLVPKQSDQHIFLVMTGGEPALQVDDELVTYLKSNGVEIAIETNGTLPLPQGIDWITVSPKANTKLIITKGNELKLVFPQEENNPTQFESFDFTHFYLQPLDNDHRLENHDLCIQYILSNPQWKLSIQSHKILGIR